MQAISQTDLALLQFDLIEYDNYLDISVNEILRGRYEALVSNRILLRQFEMLGRAIGKSFEPEENDRLRNRLGAAFNLANAWLWLPVAEHLSNRNIELVSPLPKMLQMSSPSVFGNQAVNKIYIGHMATGDSLSYKTFTLTFVQDSISFAYHDVPKFSSFRKVGERAKFVAN